MESEYIRDKLKKCITINIVNFGCLQVDKVIKDIVLSEEEVINIKDKVDKENH